jgi:hypothetical protein
MGCDNGQGLGQGIVGGSIPKGALVLADCLRITRALFFPMRTRAHFVAIAAMSSMSIIYPVTLTSVCVFALLLLSERIWGWLSYSFTSGCWGTGVWSLLERKARTLSQARGKFRPQL